MKKNNDKVMHLIGNAHIDPVWLWQWQEGYSEIKATFRSALDRMNEYPDFKFVCGAISQFKWIEENCPEMFEEIKQRVKEGRWNIVGGWWVQPDCNSPSGESFVRHSLYSQNYLKEKFGILATTGYNVDSFGHNCTIPQILKKSGMDNYIFMRPGPTEIDIPNPLFMWKSPDGSMVKTFRILDNHYNNSFRTLEKVINEAFEKSDLNTDEFMMFFGVGNHGGGPTIQALELIQKMQNEKGHDNIFISTADEYFKKIESKDASLPVWDTDIQHYASGCYATHFEFKKKHRLTEQLLLAAERFNTIAHKAVGYKDEYENLKPAWEKLLFNQFHDIMGGCSLQASLEDAQQAIGYSSHIASDVLNASLQKISWSINTSVKGAMHSKEKSGRIWSYKDHPVPLVVFNPLPFPVKAPIQLDLVLKSIKDIDGNEVAKQKIFGRYLINHQNKGMVFLADVPALGYTTYWLTPPEVPNERPPFVPDVPFETKYELENEWTKVEFDKKTGHIIRIYDKVNKNELIKTSGAQPLVMDETNYDTWGHGNDTYDDVIGEFKTKSIKVTEYGDVRTTIRVASEYGNSQLRQDFSLYKDSPDLKVRLRVNWQEKHKMLKLAFDVNTDSPKATYSIPYGYIVREADGKEEPGQMWMDLSDANKENGRGLAIACQARYSYCAKGSSMRLNVVRSPLFADHEAKQVRNEDFEHMDQGIHKMTYKLIAHDGDWRKSGVIQKALALNSPLQKVHETYHEGPLNQTMQNVYIDSEQVVMTVLKPAENGNGHIVRLYETYGEHAKVSLKIPLLKVDCILEFGAHEIKSIHVDEEGKVSQVNMIECL